MATNRDVRCKLLAEALPATSFATGANEIDIRFSGNNIDMMALINEKPWPQRRPGRDWLHGDFKDVAYYYNYFLYDDICIGRMK